MANGIPNGTLSQRVTRNEADIQRLYLSKADKDDTQRVENKLDEVLTRQTQILIAALAGLATFATGIVLILLQTPK